MGRTAEVLARECSISRDEQDRFALASHQKAIVARERCFLSGEIVPLSDQQQKDSVPRAGQSLEQLARLKTWRALCAMYDVGASQ